MKTSKVKKAYAVRRLWKNDPTDIFFTFKPISTGPYKHRIQYVIEIPRGTEYTVKFLTGEYHIFPFGKMELWVYTRGVV